MGKRKQSRKVYGESAHYWPELMLPFPMAAACIQVVLDRSERARAIYDEAVKVWNRPDCQKALSEVDMEANLKELCARIVPDLDNCTSNDKKDAYTYLDLKVKATNEGADIKGFLAPSVISTDSCLLTTGQTSA